MTRTAGARPYLRFCRTIRLAAADRVAAGGRCSPRRVRPTGARPAYVFLGAFFYGVVYTLWLKRRTAGTSWSAGWPAAFTVLAGAAAVAPGLAPHADLALVLFLWTPPDLHHPAQGPPQARAPMPLPDRARRRLQHLHDAPAALALAPFWLGMGWLYLAGAAAGGAYFAWCSMELVHRAVPGRRHRNFGVLWRSSACCWAPRSWIWSCWARPRESGARSAWRSGLCSCQAGRQPRWSRTALDEPRRCASARRPSSRLRWLRPLDSRRGSRSVSQPSGQATGHEPGLHQLLIGLPTIVQTLDAAVGTAQEALGADSFARITVGFDTATTRPHARAFARAPGHRPVELAVPQRRRRHPSTR